MEHLTLNLVAVGVLLVAAGLFHEFLPGALIKRQLKEERFGMLTCSQMARGSVTRFRDVAELLKIFPFRHTCRSPKGAGATMPKVKNPHVFMDISIGGGTPERITFEVVKLAAACLVLLFT